jgi:predicted  nucleic acid-binding Zn-ribbon protein
MSQFDLTKMGISLPKNSDPNDVKKIIKKIAAINNAIVDLIDEDEEADKEMKELYAQIKERCAKIWKKQKDIRNLKKMRQEKKLLLLGERIAYFKEMKQLGVNVKTESLEQITAGATSKKMLVEAGVS